MLTIVIPTMNRSDFLIRLLNYYANTGYKHRILIGDSSDPTHVEQAKNAIKEMEGKLSIIYQECPGLGVGACLQKLMKSISTPYVAVLSDDDYLVPNGMDKCLVYLENHPEYNAAHGKAVLISLDVSGPNGQIQHLGEYKQCSREEGAASQRLIKHLSDYSSSTFCVYRTRSWQTMLKNSQEISDRSFSDELLFSGLSVVLGKVKELDCFYLVRQGHGQRYLLPDLFDWVTGSAWLPSYRIFRDRLIDELVRVDAIDERKAQDVVKQAFWSYLSRGLAHKFRGRYIQPSAVISALRPVLNLFRSRIIPSPLSLSALLKTSSPYHDDFMPVYRSITDPACAKGVSQ
ncbi:MAG: TIGR00180 family glycosyltransferase [Candidatus Margulisiibacteriota bacterium]